MLGTILEQESIMERKVLNTTTITQHNWTALGSSKCDAQLNSMCLDPAGGPANDGAPAAVPSKTIAVIRLHVLHGLYKI